MSTKYTYISTTNHKRTLKEAYESYNIHTSALEAKLQKARTIYKQQQTELETLRTQIKQLQHEATNLFVTDDTGSNANNLEGSMHPSSI